MRVLRFSALANKPRFRALEGVAAALSLWLVASLASAHGDLHDQIAAVTREIAAHPRDARLYVKRGELHRFHGRTRAALSDYDRALLLDPALADAQLGRARSLLAADRVHDARHALAKFVRARPDDAEGRLTFARCLARLGRPRDAAAEYSRAIAFLPRPSPDVYVERARAFASAGDRTAAIRGLDEGLRRLGPIVSLEEAAIDFEVAARNWDGALARVDRVAARTPRPESWLARRGEILLAAARPGEARAAFQEALAAIERLPPRLRETRAMRRLEARVRGSLQVSEIRSVIEEKNDAKS
jgi:tetratricopeptide (TPR) repeat protein